MTFVPRDSISEGDTDYIKEIEPTSSELVGLSENRAGSLDKLNELSRTSGNKIHDICPQGVIAYYPGKIIR